MSRAAAAHRQLAGTLERAGGGTAAAAAHCVLTKAAGLHFLLQLLAPPSELLVGVVAPAKLHKVGRGGGREGAAGIGEEPLVVRHASLSARSGLKERSSRQRPGQ